MVTVAGISGTFLIWLHSPDTCLTGKAFLRSHKPKADHRSVSLVGSEWYAWNPFDQQNKTTRQITERKKVNNFFWESIPTTDLLSREGIRSLESPDLRDFLVLRGTQRNRNLEQNILILNWDGYKMYATCSPLIFALGPKGEFHDSSKTLRIIISATIHHSLICIRGYFGDKTQWPNTKYRRHSGQIPP